MSFGEWFETRLEKEFPTELLWYGAGIFAVAREKIQQREKAFYQKLIKDVSSFNPEAGHYFERSWVYIFNIF